jgi:rhodanese-related sulfurtransferase
MAKLGREKGTLNIRYLKGGLAAWKGDTKEEEEEPRISSYNLKPQGSIKQGRIFLLDVRTPDEFKGWNIEGSDNIPMAKVPESLGQIPKNKEVITICPHGNRSSMVTLMLQRLGYNVKTLERGLKSWSSTFEYTSKVFDIINSTLSNPKVRIVQIRGCISYIIGQEENRQGKEVYSYANNSNNNDDDRKEIIVIDPVFPAEEYIRIANKEFDLSSNNITKVFDTHLHADHVSAARV